MIFAKDKELVMGWIIATIAVVGVIYNIRKNRLCFALWLFTNGFWFWRNIKTDEYAQAVTFAIFFGVCLYGIFAWGPRRPH